MMTVTHTCGHTQGTPGIERIAFESIIRKLKTEDEALLFIEAQRNFLEANLCPECYRAEKARNPSLKPVGGYS